jgi:hypothetical protein
MSVVPFDIYEFSSDHLYKALSSNFLAPSEIATHRSAPYLDRYLHDLNAQTIVIEYDYTDRDYLDDFAAYYVKCFFPYDRHCKRLHFFSVSITRDTFIQLVQGSLSLDAEQKIRESYLGFVVVRPLPDAIIGRTVLATYPNSIGKRNYTCTKNYSANLFGIDLSIQSLAFQEQDTVLAACATVSLWCCFHKTGELFNTPILTPAAITRAANQVIRPSRPIPSHGLNVLQICDAITHVGLEPEVIRVNAAVPLVSLLYGYLKMGLPIILGVEIEGHGQHAIALVGYSLRDEPVMTTEIVASSNYIPMIGLRIDEFYAHDDQIGPFSKIRVVSSTTNAAFDSPIRFESSWNDESTGKTLVLTPKVVIIPVYHKIRVTFLELQKWITRLTKVLNRILEQPPSLEWDIHLTTTNDYKKSIKKSDIPAEILEHLLLKQHPRFIWHATVSQNAVAILELLADATDMARSLPIYEVVWLNEDIKAAFKQLLESPQYQNWLHESLTHRFGGLLMETLH